MRKMLMMELKTKQDIVVWKRCAGSGPGTQIVSASVQSSVSTTGELNKVTIHILGRELYM